MSDNPGQDSAALGAKLASMAQSSGPVSAENITSGDALGSGPSPLQNMGPQIITPHSLRMFGEGKGVGDFLASGGIALFVDSHNNVMEINLDNISSLMAVKVAHEGVMKDLQSLGHVGLGEATGIVTNLNANLPKVGPSQGQEAGH